ncbi:hypothetical protein Scep_029281 [Stephania cephalantha]|uniref:Rhamnogalacturonase A/B/Epimerase-like pectate lyase domain-containing protein n=1 Tax=Stephania cephalantha TaxID=152367 RepID=A0AAP0DXC5_9MAGN
MSTMVLMINLTSSSVAFAAPTSFNVVDLGAKSDGRTDSTRAFLRAWESACASPSSATIYVPQGRYLLDEVLFAGECKGRVTFKIDGTLVAPSDYHILGTSGKWITFNKVQGVSISGGILDGQGAGLWACKVRKELSFWSQGMQVKGIPTGTRISCNGDGDREFKWGWRWGWGKNLIPTRNPCGDIRWGMKSGKFFPHGDSPSPRGLDMDGDEDESSSPHGDEYGDGGINS